MTKVVKIGGDSQSKPKLIEAFVAQVNDTFDPEEPLLIVNSAIAKTTDDLLEAMKSDSGIFHILEAHQDFFNTFGGDKNLYDRIIDDFVTFYKAYSKNPSAQLRAALLVSPERVASFILSNAFSRVRKKRPVVWLDFYNKEPRFPLIATEGDKNYLSASVDLILSEEVAVGAKKLLERCDIVMPGFGGISYADSRLIKTFGRGGSDEAAFACGYLFDADVWICTNVKGIKQAVLEGEYKKETPTVPYIDVKEAQAGAFLGAKLPSQQALMPLEASYAKGSRPKACIVNAQDLGGDKTEICPAEDNTKLPAKFIAGRDIALYYIIEGDTHTLIELEKEITEAGIDRRIMNTGSRTEISVFGKGSDIADDIVKKYRKKGFYKLERDTERAIVGVVGSGMETAEGMIGRFGKVLGDNGINVYSSNDYGGISLVSVISRYHRPKAIASLYEALPFIRGVK